MFCDSTQSMCREERQCSNDEDNSKRHDTECYRIGLQCSGTFGNISFLCQQTGNGNLSHNRNETAQNKNDTAEPLLAAHDVYS